MANEEEKSKAPVGLPAIPQKAPLPLIPLLNTVALLGAIGLAVYSKILFKRPPITEKEERSRLVKLHSSPTPAPKPVSVSFGPITVNIQSNPSQPKPADGTFQQIQGKLHYVTLGFSVEIRDENQKDLLDAVHPILLDKIIYFVGKKTFHELTTVQGRYILQSSIHDMGNELINARMQKPLPEGLITHVYFTQFIVQ